MYEWMHFHEGGEMERKEFLEEILPYLRKFQNKIVVVKYGRNEEEKLKKMAADDIVTLKNMMIYPIVVHGGGPKISEEMAKRGLTPQFVGGQRKTTPEVIKIIRETVYPEIQQEIVSLLTEAGGLPISLIGSENQLLIAKKFYPKSGEVDLGYVGEIEKINKPLLEELTKGACIPVISPLGISRNGEVYNINADSAAGAIASLLGAEKLIMVTNKDGVIEDGGLLSHLTAQEAAKKINDGVVTQGMIPKVEACIRAVAKGVPKAHIINGTYPHSLLLEVFTDKGVGTEIVRSC